MKIKSRVRLGVLFLLVLVSVFSLGIMRVQSADDGFRKTFYGDSVRQGDGFMRSFVTLDKNGNPLKIGVKFSTGVLSDLPAEPVRPIPTETFTLPLPDRVNVPPFKQIELRYWSQGHNPDIPGYLDFEHEHFDFMYFLINQEQRDQICPTPRTDNTVPFKCDGQVQIDYSKTLPQLISATGDVAKAIRPPVPGAIPTDYMNIVPLDNFFAEPTYGTRFLDTKGTYDPFFANYFAGFYDGQMVFYDLGVVDSLWKYLQTTGKPNTISVLIKQPSGGIYPETGYYPTTFSINYNGADQFTISLDGLTFRSAQDGSG